jgi:methionine-rich copper-binding protein CopC
MNANLRPIAAAWLAVVLACGAAPAFAHAALQRAMPAVGGEVSGSPTQVQLWFSEALEPALSKVEVKNAAGASVNAGYSKVAADDKRRIDVPVTALAAGTYRVEWAVVSVDGHKTSGSFVFTVK